MAIGIMDAERIVHRLAKTRDERFVHLRPDSRLLQYGELIVHRELTSCFLTSGLSVLDAPLLSLRFADSGTASVVEL